MESLPVRIFASAAVDISLAVICGLLLVRHWLSGTTKPVPSLRLPAAVLCLGGALQLFSLTASFTGKSALPQLCLALPDICATHPGKALALALAASLLLLGLSFTPSLPAQAVALVLCLLFRSGTGHAATENILSLPQAMQFLHLGSMSVWSGAVLIAGLAVLPRPAFAASPGEVFAGLLAALSRTATWALAGVLVSGAYRGYTGLEGSFGMLLHTEWGLTLLAKLAAVAAALALGALNRLALNRNPAWLPAQRVRTSRLLRAEAFVMLAILALSATLANLPPPGD